MEIREHRDDLLRRIPLLRSLFFVVLAIVGGGYWFVQIVQGSHYLRLAENNRLRKLAVTAPRGLIFDQRGNLLVENVPSYDLLLDRSRTKDLPGSLEFAARILARTADELDESAARIQGMSRFSPVVIAENLALSEVARLSVSSLEHPEFEIEVGHLRLYRHGPQTAHVLGHLGEVTARDLSREDSPYKAGDQVGKRGVELAFDRDLRGVSGERVVVVDSHGRSREEFGSRRAVAGGDLHLTLDLALQQQVARYFEDRVGAAVALDPRDGAIRLLYSSPSYDPNIFARRLDVEEWRKVLEAPNHPLQNRVLQSAYSPGSIFKIVVAVAGLSEGAVAEQGRVFCGGSARIYNRRFRCWKRTGHGTVDLRKAIKESCDVYFYQLGQRLGIARLAHFARLFGFGRTTGIDVRGERAGLVPDSAWSLRVRGTAWYPGETISVAIGQGPLLVTPIQMASMMAMVANGGYRVTPYLWQKGRSEPELVPIDPEALATVREALWAVVNEQGTGSGAWIPGFEIAGKTGTVQVIEQKTWVENEDLPFEQRDHAWFASFGPYESPELVVVVFVEHGGKGSSEAAPLARLVYERFQDLRGDHESS